MKNWARESNKGERNARPKDHDEDESYFNDDSQSAFKTTSAISFARNSNILSTSKYGLPTFSGKVEDEDPLDAFMKEIEQQTLA